MNTDFLVKMSSKYFRKVSIPQFDSFKQGD